ncbi:uncharacterized protein CYBJADRAFT_29779 [Cyberlindnera jadinii NRRL Y-1542]|uniref:Uncharacterized protein n=1 Tax=Cyberlindnera jadinii (strain ATCC 18201 / CBS 1600 / BCRC 20928 / JCM 3617 / NBRC 0987 / NRRL Y-1542) TaxID=983966 RepID=A0A1E4RWR2_CYBJN|nr:hypothetical protein CYBJADRAFT_29779 [Cyberlindnera jadinii NRRL Y-1542]ODV71631.1 hypothetical protein CYBJADRAFT_29779 [Cyberlindnera jadinii NRRL Y-1542]
MIAQENGQEKFTVIFTLDPGLATNRHLELLRGVLRNDEEYDKLEDYISKIGEFLSQNNRYAQLLYTARKWVDRKLQRWDWQEMRPLLNLPILNQRHEKMQNIVLLYYQRLMCLPWCAEAITAVQTSISV